MAVLGVAVLVHLLVEPAYYQRMLVARLERRLHRRVTVTSADVTLWPGLGLRLRNVAISKKPPEPDHPVLSMEALRINVRLLPLLARRIVVQRIVIERPVMAVARDEDGTLRLADLLGEPERQESGVEEHRLSPPVESLLVATTEISHGEVRLFDQATTPGAVTIRLSDLSLEVEQLASGSRPQFKLDAKIGTPGAGGSVALAGRIGPLRWSWPAPNLSVDGEVRTFALDVQPFLPYLPAQWRRAIRRGLLTSELSVRGRLDGNVTAQGKLRLEQVELRSGSSRLAGAIEGEFAAAGRRGVAGGVASHLRIDATEADYRQGSVFHKEPGTKLVIEGDVLGERGSVRVRRVAGALGAIPFAGAGKIGRPDRAGRALLVLRFDPTVIDLATLPGYVAATSPLALRGRADVRGVEIRRRPEKRRSGRCGPMSGSRMSMPSSLSREDARTRWTISPPAWSSTSTGTHTRCHPSRREQA